MPLFHRDHDRLDPPRWRGPSTWSLVRAALVAVLLVLAAMIVWTGSQTCSPQGLGP